MPGYRSCIFLQCVVCICLCFGWRAVFLVEDYSSSGLVPTGRYFYGGFFLLLTGYVFISSVPHFFPYKRPTLAFLSSQTYQVAEADCASDIERKRRREVIKVS